jgi:GTP cyclohydrolase I
VSSEDFLALDDDMRTRLEASESDLEVRFPYFVRKAAPVSGVSSLLDIDAAVYVRTRTGHGQTLSLEVTTPVTSLCPCSKTISDYGAHNQRSRITLKVDLRASMSLETLVRVAENAASCPVYGLLKRPDEKYVTERAYDNPKFVEDLVRDLALALHQDPRVLRYTVIAENFESIHNHSAYAEISGGAPHAHAV